MRGATLLFLVAAAPALAQNAELAKAEQQFEAFKYAEADKSLSKALSVPDNDRATLVRIYALRGILDATLGKKTAVEHFRRLVTIDPEHSLSRDLGPRILQPFYEAKARADESPPLKLETSATFSTNGQTLKAVGSNDSFGLAATVRLFWKTKGGEWSSKDEPITPEGTVQLVPGTDVEYRAQLLTATTGVLVEAGTAEVPLKAAAPVTPAELRKPLVEQRKPGGPMGPGRAAGIGLAAGGAAALVGSIISGVISSAARGEVENPKRDENMRLVGMTPERARELENRTVGGAVASNILLVTGLVLAAGGTALILFDPGGARVEVAPAAGGVVLNGRF